MTMRPDPLDLRSDGFASLEASAVRVLNPIEERSLLRELAECKSKLAQALAANRGIEVPAGGDVPKALAIFLSATYVSHGSKGARLGAVYRRYSELRSKLALANLRLVAHVAKRFRERGVPYSDLLQEGFCGLLEAIDRFEMTHRTKLATYATWWIRHSMQRVVASTAYPVRLTPRHLRQLARTQDRLEREEREGGSRADDDPAGHVTEMIDRIRRATRPTISLDAATDPDSKFSLLQTMSDPDGDRTEIVDTDEAIEKLMRALRPREQQVLSLRFGLQGRDRLSLSQVGLALRVSKERVRQIQDRALQKLRLLAQKENLIDRLAISPR
jgi:RNA polymerase primary sigma factor